MLFNSYTFLLFFPIVLLLYFIFPIRGRNYILLLASYFFYACWDARFIVLLLFTTIITYFSGIKLEDIKNNGYDVNIEKKKKNIVVGFSFIVNLLILFYFKYTNFGINVLNNFYYLITGAKNILPKFNIILPVGISFFTFQALSYTMDVYRGEIYAEKNFFKYALFVSFFPQLVAGPIERSKNLLKQLSEPKKFDYDNAREGLLIMIWGYFLKMVIADRVAIVVNTVYADINKYPGFYLIVATILFAIQIYCDFAGYSTIAMGCAKFFNINLMENFDAPYLSTSVANFWRRWHISLTSWFRDYLYIPLGGSRKGKLRKYINIMIVFLVSGLWHGASLSFVVWGGVNGLYQVIGNILLPIRNKIKEVFNVRDTLDLKIINGIITFVFVDFAWIFFRANRLRDAFSIIRNIITHKNIWILFDGSLFKMGLDSANFMFMVFSIMLLFFVDYMKRKGILIRKEIIEMNVYARIFIVSFSIVFILVFGIWGPGYDVKDFIYFQF